MGRAGIKNKGKRAEGANEAEAKLDLQPAVQPDVEPDVESGGAVEVQRDWLPELQQAIRQEMQQKCAAMAKAWVTQASKGSVSSFRIILQMRKMQGEADGGQDGAYSQAGVWLEEPEWHEERCEASAELHSGGVEPEA